MSLLPSVEFAVNNSMARVEERFPEASHWMAVGCTALVAGTCAYMVLYKFPKIIRRDNAQLHIARLVAEQTEPPMEAINFDEVAVLMHKQAINDIDEQLI